MANMIRQLHSNNISSIRRSPLAEVSGSLGDLGTLLPLMIALAINNSISLSATLVVSGAGNICAGFFFGIPLPVQPMKAIAAVAIARNFTVEETISAGFATSAVVFIFSVTGLLSWFTRVIPTPVVKGIQVGAGFSLVLSAGSSLLQPLGWKTPNGFDNLLWVIFAFLALQFNPRFPRVPYALVIFVLGLVSSIIISGTGNLPTLQIWHPHTFVPSWADFKVGALDAGLGQIPLTTLNSVIAVTYLAADLLPHIPTPGVTSIGISVALMNLIGGWFGAMPVCHGSGGLAAQFRFGARSGASIIILGLFKMILGFFFGESLVGLLKVYPRSLLGVMVLAAGLELAKVGESLNCGARDLWEPLESRTGTEEEDEGAREGTKRQRQLSDEERRERWTTMSTTIALLLAFRNDGVGFLAGMLCHWTYQLTKAWQAWESWKKKNYRRAEGQRTTTVEEEEEQLLSET